MKKTTNIYYLIDCSFSARGSFSRTAQRQIIKAQRTLNCQRFSAEVKTHLIGYNDKALFLDAFQPFPATGNPMLQEGLKMLQTVLCYQRTHEPLQTRSVFLLYSSGEILQGWQRHLHRLYTFPEFAQGLRYSIVPQPFPNAIMQPFTEFADFPDRVLPYFSENRLCSLIQSIAKSAKNAK